MAEESDLEKTESASPRRIEKAREEGNVPRSRELATCTLLLAAGIAFWVLGSDVMRELTHMLTTSMSFDRAHAFDSELLLVRCATYMTDVLIALSPFALVLIITALGSPLLIGGWLFSPKAFQPNFGKLNPLKGISNIFSIRSIVELVKAIAKALLIGFVSWVVISKQMDAMVGLSVEPVKNGVIHLGDLLLVSFISIVSALVVIAFIDAPYQMWQYAQKLKMTRDEVKQESKESEGNPEIKAKIRAQQREMARRRMMAQVPTADVVVTNPTRFAVAIKYDESGSGAPRVVAKGMGVIAARIREIAVENNVTLLEAPALARALHKHVDLDREIPETLYLAVAEVLAYVFQLRAFRTQGGFRPQVPTNIPVPQYLDPKHDAPQPAIA
ncbi:MAG: flagellar type III secretion system protein FlhB [Oxalobacter sp.]|nr:MAG: flagellar type III secretion system protein FlhB [Oxalobacter sp.]